MICEQTKDVENLFILIKYKEIVVFNRQGNKAINDYDVKILIA